MIILGALALLGMFIYGLIGTGRFIWGVASAIFEQIRLNKERTQRQRDHEARFPSRPTTQTTVVPTQTTSSASPTVVHPVHKRNGQP